MEENASDHSKPLISISTNQFALGVVAAFADLGGKAIDIKVTQSLFPSLMLEGLHEVIPLVDLSEPVSRGIGDDPRLIGARPDHTLGSFTSDRRACALGAMSANESAVGRYCCKSPKLLGDNFPAIRRSDRRTPICAASTTLPSSPVSLSAGAMRSPTSLHESRVYSPENF